MDCEFTHEERYVFVVDVGIQRIWFPRLESPYIINLFVKSFIQGFRMRC